MVWDRISRKVKTLLVFINATLNCEEYTEMLYDVHRSFFEKYYPHGCMFPQNAAPAHTARYTQDLFMEEDMQLLPWAARSPDMNYI